MEPAPEYLERRVEIETKAAGKTIGRTQLGGPPGGDSGGQTGC